MLNRETLRISGVMILCTSYLILAVPSAMLESHWYKPEAVGPNGITHTIPISGTNNYFLTEMNDDLWYCENGDCQKFSYAKTSTFHFSYSDSIMYYDEQLDRIVGISAAGYLDWDVWIFHGTWIHLGECDYGPFDRNFANWAWDPVRRRCVLYGGWLETGKQSSETWEWDGWQWSQIHPPNNPGFQNHGQMVYDSTNQRMIMTARNPDDNTMEFWSWNGEDWTRIDEPSGFVPWKNDRAFALNVTNGEMALFGGKTYVYNVNDELWHWDGQTWQAVELTSGPMPRSQASIFFDSSGNLVLTGGLFYFLEESGFEFPRWHADIWTTDFVTWTQVHMHPRPASTYKSYNAGFNLDAGKGLLVVRDQETFYTYEWHHNQWKHLFPMGSPSGVNTFKITHQRHNDSYLLMGCSETDMIHWTYKDDTWAANEPLIKPSAREFYSLTYHDDMDRVVLYGGIEGSYWNADLGALCCSTICDKMWLWDGSNWEQAELPDPGPSKLYKHSMAYDPVRNRLVIAGGRLGADYSVMNDDAMSNCIWEWDGQSWISIPYPGEEGPSEFNTFNLIYHATRNTLIQISRKGAGWEWNGTRWTPLPGYVGYNFVTPMCSVAFYDNTDDRLVVQDNCELLTFYFDAEDTGLPCKSTGVTLELSQNEFHPGDLFTCKAVICNRTSMNMNGCPLFVLLDVYGELYFGPGWSSTFDNYLAQLPIISSGVSEFDAIPSFFWPDGCGSASGLRLIAAITDPEVRGIAGLSSIVEFGWSE